MARAEVISDVEMVLTEAASKRSSYLSMLDTISKFHKYDLKQQASLAMYAWPNYTAVADERIWIQGFHTHIKQDAHAIEILDDNAPNGVKVVYDASDTGLSEERQAKLLWRFDAAQHKDVFRGIADEGTTAVDGVLQVCWQVEDALAEKDMNSEEIRLLSESIGYVLLKRLGFEREAVLLAEQTISDTAFKEGHISLEDVSNISREILNGIQEYVQKGKGRDEAFPLRAAMECVQEIISQHDKAEKVQQETVISVEVAETEERDATQEAAVLEEAAASTEAPAVNAKTGTNVSVGAETKENDLFLHEQQETAPAVEDSVTEGSAATEEGGILPEASVAKLPTDGSVPVSKENNPQKFHGGKKGDAFQRNVTAIRVLKMLEKEHRPIDDEMERGALSAYSGFGNLSEVFDEKNESWQAERDFLKSLLTNEEYAAARSSILSAFYTDADIVAAIYDGISRMGFENGNILDEAVA